MAELKSGDFAISRPIEYSEEYYGRIGGNAPILLDGDARVKGLNFYATVIHPYKASRAISIFIPRDYNRLLSGAMYPDFAVVVCEHAQCVEGALSDHCNGDLTKVSVSNYQVINGNDYSGALVTIGGNPSLIQDEDYYFRDLERDGYEFFMQIDESYYLDGAISGNYPFSYGALYLYMKQGSNGEVISGFWQHS